MDARLHPRPLARRLILVTLATLALTGLHGRAQGPQVPSLFVAPAAGARVPMALSQRVDTLQARPVGVNAAAMQAPAFDVELEPGRVVRAVLDRRDTHRNGVQAWVGHVDGVALSSVTLAWLDGVVQGSIATLDDAYSIEPSGAPGVHVMRQVDPGAMPPEAEPMLPPPGGEPDAGRDPRFPTATDDGSTFDVIAFYTPAAEAAALAAGTAISTRIALGVSETNTAYANSGVIPRLRLVGTQRTNYTEAGYSTDLSRFAGTSDGFMDEVHAARNAAGADLAVLIIGNDPGACGVAYVMTSASTAFASGAFSVTVYGCISPNYTFGHEIGHNLGSAHAPEDGAGQASVYPYSFGYKHPGNLFRTVMAYNCSAGCPRVLRVSSPSAVYNGNATGVAGQHDNAQSINNVRNAVANFRPSVGAGTPPTISSIANLSVAQDTSSSPIAFTVGDLETPAASLTVTTSSSNPTLLPNTSAAMALGGSGASRTLTLTPAAGQSGTATVSVVVSDGALTASRSFVITVVAGGGGGGGATTPGAPGSFAVTFSGRSVFMTWTPPTTGGAPTSYALEAGSGPGASDLVVVPLGATTSFAAAGVPDGVFWLRIRAANASGWGPASNEIGVSMRPTGGCVGLPLAVTFNPATVSGNNVVLSWSAPAAGPGPAVTSYVLGAGTAPGLSNITVFDTGSTARSLGAVAPSGVYFLRAAARNACGVGPQSNEVAVVVP